MHNSANNWSGLRSGNLEDHRGRSLYKQSKWAADLTLERPTASIDAFAVFQSSPCHYRWHEKCGKNGLFIIYGLVQKNKRHGKFASSINQADVNIPRTTDCVNWRTRQHFVYWHESESTCVCTRLPRDYSHSTMFSFAYCAHIYRTLEDYNAQTQ